MTEPQCSITPYKPRQHVRLRSSLQNLPLQHLRTQIHHRRRPCTLPYHPPLALHLHPTTLLHQYSPRSRLHRRHNRRPPVLRRLETRLGRHKTLHSTRLRGILHLERRVDVLDMGRGEGDDISRIEGGRAKSKSAHPLPSYMPWSAFCQTLTSAA